MIRPFLAIYLGHLLTDFPLQTSRLVEQKRRGKPGAYLIHGLIHYFCATLLLGFFVPGSILSLRTQAVLIALTLVHLLVDLVKIRLTAKHLVKDSAWAYISDQVIHFITVVIAAALISPAGSFAALAAVFEKGRVAGNAILLVPVTYLAVIFGGGYLVRLLTSIRPAACGSTRQGTGLQL
jgi:Protein of unknown function (DUF3307)